MGTIRVRLGSGVPSRDMHHEAGVNMLNITGYIWREDMIDKLAWKHQVQVEEVVQVFQNVPRVKRFERGHRPGEDLYVALGQTDAGRYLAVFFIFKKNGRALINTARDMTRKERRRYGKK